MQGKTIKFSKYVASGNDIVIFDFPSLEISLNERVIRKFVQNVADRHWGVGADEIVFLNYPISEKYIATIEFFNSDGSKAKVCGNGLRCIAKHLYEKGISKGAKEFFVSTASGIKPCKVFTNQSGEVTKVRVSMGSVKSLSIEGNKPSKVEFKISDKKLWFIPVSMGNPHAVFFSKISDEDKKQIWEKLQNHSLFPDGVNVGYANVVDKNNIELVVWERGCGPTLACGSGACAAVSAAVFINRCRMDEKVAVKMPGGIIKIKISSKNSNVYMEGTARRVFTGEIDSINFYPWKPWDNRF